MKTARLPRAFIIIFIVFIGISIASFLHVKDVYSSTNHVVISEIQIAGTIANDEFVELYNPTNDPVNLSGWRLGRESAAGNLQTPPVASLSGTINPHGYFLIAHPSSSSSASADILYTATSSGIAANNTVLLYSDAGSTIVDKVGMGTATDIEASAAANPLTGKSIERKANSGSTSSSMNVGGSDEFAGNGEDTDHNNVDFVLRDIPLPQHSASPTEPVEVTPSPTPSETPTLTPTESPTTTPTPSSTPTETPTNTPTTTPSPTQTPTSTPTMTPSPTFEPTNTPTVTPSPTAIPTNTPTMTPNPTATPTSTPTMTPSPTVDPSNTPSPTVTSTPTQIPTSTLTTTPSPTMTIPLSPTPTPRFPKHSLQCEVTYRLIRTPFATFKFPQLHCHIVRS